MLKKAQKKEIVAKLAKDLTEAKGIVFSDFQGLPTKDIQELRALLRKDEVRHKVVKLSLLKLALQRAGVDASGFNFQVPLAVSMSEADEAVPAKITAGFAKTHNMLKVLGGVLEKKLVGAVEVKKLAELPSKAELRSQVVGAIASPLRGLVWVLSGNLCRFLNVLNAIKQVKS